MEIEVRHDLELKEVSYFKIGGKVKNLYYPKSVNEFLYLLKKLNKPLIFGGFSNVLFSSTEVEQDIICTQKMNSFTINNCTVTSLAGVRGAVLSRACIEQSLTGFEFMSGFPGSIGGNIYMNASAHKQCISDNLIKVKVFDTEKKEVIELPKKELGFSYRTSILQSKPYILLDTEFELKKGNKEEIKQTILNNREFRKAHQPQALPNVGSIFRNPDGDSAGRMLDEIGAKSFKIGGAKVFENHANFIINDNNATSTDVLELMLMMYNNVKEKYNVKLKPEVKYFGKQTDREKEICTILFQK